MKEVLPPAPLKRRFPSGVLFVPQWPHRNKICVSREADLEVDSGHRFLSTFARLTADSVFPDVQCPFQWPMNLVWSTMLMNISDNLSLKHTSRAFSIQQLSSKTII